MPAGTQWTSMMAEQNTGTGNSQWIVVDYNRRGRDSTVLTVPMQRPRQHR